MNFHPGLLNIFRDIDQDGARSSRGGNPKGLRDNGEEFSDVPDQKVVFGDRNTQSIGINLLKSICPDKGGWNLTRDADNRDAIEPRIGNGGQYVRRSRPGGCETDLDFSADAGHALCDESGALLVPCKNVSDPAIPGQGIINGKVCPSRDARDGFDPLPFEEGDDDVSACI